MMQRALKNSCMKNTREIVELALALQNDPMRSKELLHAEEAKEKLCFALVLQHDS